MWMRVISIRSPRTRAVLGVVALIATLSLASAGRLVIRSLHGAMTTQSPPISSPHAIYRVATTQKALALAINVVWGSEYIPALLKDLTAAHAPATFFLGGAWAADHPALVHDIVAHGMAVGNHGYRHRHQSRLSFDENLEEITQASRAIELAGAPRPTLFAPPYGEYNATVLQAATALHLHVIMWTIDTIDWRPTSSVSRIVERVTARVAPGAIVLMHPTHRTVEALPKILSALTAQGYRFLTVSQLMALGVPQGE